MKQYTSRELSERLVKLGCKSQSRQWHPQLTGHLDKPPTPTFEFEDFCGTHEQADQNARILNFELGYTESYFKELKIEIMRTQDWLKYLEKVMEEIAA